VAPALDHRGVTKDKAIERVRKLREVTVARGATEHEAATALALAGQLSARFGLDRPAVVHSHVARYATSARSDRRSSRSLRFVAFG
jgi:DNA-binding transcriptional regulator LsrR (DeoR family)